MSDFHFLSSISSLSQRQDGVYLEWILLLPEASLKWYILYTAMNEKHVVFIFVVLLLVGISTATVNSIQHPGKVTPTPSPTPDPQLFGASQMKDSQTAFAQNQPLNNPAQMLNPAQLQQAQQPPQVQQQMPVPTPTPTLIPARKTYRQFPGILAPEELQNKKAVIETNKGTIEFEIYPEATKAASNFIFLARDGFYDGLTFHRVEPGFVIQGGDPTGTGNGGPGYEFDDDKPIIRNYDKGTVAMANSGPNTNGSQFFIMLADKPDLPKDYTIFGKVITGQDVVDKIQIGDVMNRVTIESLTSAGP